MTSGRYLKNIFQYVLHYRDGLGAAILYCMSLDFYGAVFTFVI